MTRMRARTIGALLGTVLLLGGCATKRDVRSLREQMQLMQDRQAELLRDIQQQNRLLLDSIRAAMSMTQDVRGATTGQLRQFEQTVNQLGNLVGQLMGSLTRIEERLGSLEQRVTSPVTPASSGAHPDSLYNQAMLSYGDKRYAPARILFEQIVEEFSTHERAADAQFYLGQISADEKNFAAAYSELEKVVQQWPLSPRAPAALMRAGAIAEEQRDLPRARDYYTQVREKYSETPDATLAARRLQAIRR